MILTARSSAVPAKDTPCFPEPGTGAGRARGRFVLFAVVTLIGPTLGVGKAAGQAPTGLDPSPLTPRSAFLRSLVVPGWGHMVSGSYQRGGVYFVIQAASAWMLWKSWAGRSEAERRGAAERAAVTDRLVAEGVTDPFERSVQLEEDPMVQRLQGLVDVRGDQVEDWAAFSIFMVLLGATDAYVSAHLADFPEPLSLDVRPAGRGRGVELGWTLPIGGLD